MSSHYEDEDHSEFEDISFVIRPTEAFLQAEVDFLLRLHVVSVHCRGHNKAERHIDALQQLYTDWKRAEYPSDKLQEVKESIQKGLQYIAHILKVTPPATEPYRYHFLGDDIHKLVPKIDKIKVSFMQISKEHEDEDEVTAKSHSLAAEVSGASSVAISHGSGSGRSSDSEISELEDISFVLRSPHAEDLFLQTLREALAHSTDNKLTSKYLKKCLKNYEDWKAADYPNHQFSTLSANIEKWLDRAAASTNSLEASVHRPTAQKKQTFFEPKPELSPKILSDIEQSMLCFESIETIKTTNDAMEKDLHTRHHP